MLHFFFYVALFKRIIQKFITKLLIRFLNINFPIESSFSEKYIRAILPPNSFRSIELLDESWDVSIRWSWHAVDIFTRVEEKKRESRFGLRWNSSNAVEVRFRSLRQHREPPLLPKPFSRFLPMLTESNKISLGKFLRLDVIGKRRRPLRRYLSVSNHAVTRFLLPLLFLYTSP